MKLFNIRISIGFILCLWSFSAPAEQQTLTVATWGGSYERAQQKTLFDPFEAATGIQINTQFYSGEIAILKLGIKGEGEVALNNKLLILDLLDSIWNYLKSVPNVAINANKLPRSDWSR